MARRSGKSGFDVFINLIPSMLKAIEKNNKHQIKAEQKQLKQAQINVSEPQPHSYDSVIKQFPEFTIDRLPKEPLKTNDAVKIYREFMVEIDFFDTKSELSQHVVFLRHELSGYRESLEEDLVFYREDIQEKKDELLKLKTIIRTCSDSDKLEIEDEISELEDEIESLKDDFESARDFLRNYKNDKRDFLFNYINREVHGPRHNTYHFCG